jgi:hypothetical protein
MTPVMEHHTTYHYYIIFADISGEEIKLKMRHRLGIEHNLKALVKYKTTIRL